MRCLNKKDLLQNIVIISMYCKTRDSVLQASPSNRFGPAGVKAAQASLHGQGMMLWPGQVLPGERVPVDGNVLAGRGSCNEAMLTGESALVPKAPGAQARPCTCLVLYPLHVSLVCLALVTEVQTCSTL